MRQMRVLLTAVLEWLVLQEVQPFCNRSKMSACTKPWLAEIGTTDRNGKRIVHRHNHSSQFVKPMQLKAATSTMKRSLP